MTSYIGWSLSIESTIRLPGALPQVDPAASPKIVVTHDHVASADPDRVLGPYSVIGETLVVTVPGVGRFSCRPDAVVVDALAGADPQEVQGLLIATALPAAIWMRGDIVLHAAAVEIDGCAVAITGPSGVGKSRLVQAFQESGARILADDSLRLMRHNGTVLAAGLPACFFRREPGSSERRECAIPPSLSSMAAPLTLIAELDASATGMSRAVDGVTAMATLLRSRHRPLVPKLLRSDGRHFAEFARIAKSIPVVRWPTTRAAELVDAVLRDGMVRATAQSGHPQDRR